MKKLLFLILLFLTSSPVLSATAELGKKSVNNIVPIETSLPTVSGWTDITATAAQPTGLGTGVGSWQTYRWRRSGDTVEVQCYYLMSVSGSGTSIVIFPPPTGLTPVHTTAVIGSGNTYNVTHTQPSTVQIVAVPVSTTSGGFTIPKMGTAFSVQGQDLGSTAQIRFSAKIKITEWADEGITGQTNVTAYIQNATETTPGLLSAVDQTIGGVKTFNSGIKPSASSDTLTAYEEGTYTPTIDNDTTNISASPPPAASSARYVRIGNFVQVWIRITATLTITGTTEINFTVPVGNISGSSSANVNGTGYRSGTGTPYENRGICRLGAANKIKFAINSTAPGAQTFEIGCTYSL